MNFHKIIAFFALATLVGSPTAAFARVNVDVDETDYAPYVGDWNEYGETDVLSDGRVRLESYKSRTGYAYTDVDVSRRHEGDYAVFIAYTRAEKPQPALANGAENIAGLPYLYGYFLDDDGRINEYFTNSYMRHDHGVHWEVTYGYMPVPDDTESVRLFLKQASRNGTEADGRDAWFYRPGLFFVESRDEVRDIVEAYEDELDELSDAFDGRASNALHDRDHHDGDFSHMDVFSGMLVKCPGEADVYSVTSSGALKRFPNEETFYAWGHTFAEVKTISCARLDDYRVAGTWTYERADYLVKFDGQPAVFTLDNGFVLRLIPDEDTARDLFGRHWEDDVREYSVGKMGDYAYGVPHRSTR
jgi:hypothetical protein